MIEQWQYVFVGVQYIEDIPMVYCVNDHHLPNWEDGPSLHIFINNLAQEGWSLTSVGYDSHGQIKTLVLQRAVESG
ncbi:MAG: hypothetical protein HC837_09615 [Chloroflexaceae bacterium]|nr:hypothetical protein [Chloroflexaceae bacterium]